MRKLLRFALDLIVLLFLLALSPVFGQYVTLQGILQSSNGLPAVNDTISFTPTQWFYVAGTGVSVNSTTFCGTSVDGSVVGYPNPLQSLVVTPAFTGTLPAGNYYVEYAFYTQHLLTSTTTLVSPETVVQLTSTGELVIPPPASGIPAGINGMRVYIGTTSGAETLQGQTTGPATYTQSIPLVTGATPPATNTTVCIQTANDAGWPTGTGYVVSLADPSGNTLPGYPMSWQLLGPNTTINLSSGLPYYNGVVIYPSPILASPQNHAAQSISGPLSLGAYGLTAGSVTTGTINNVCQAAGQVGSDFAAKVNACIAQLRTGAGLIDATGLVGAQTCSSANLIIPQASVLKLGAGVTITGTCTVELALGARIEGPAPGKGYQEAVGNEAVWQFTGTGNFISVYSNEWDTSLANVTFQGPLYLAGNTGTGTGQGLYITGYLTSPTGGSPSYGVAGVTLDHVTFLGFWQDGIHIEDNVYLVDCFRCIALENGGWGWFQSEAFSQQGPNQVQLYSPYFESNAISTGAVSFTGAISGTSLTVTGTPTGVIAEGQTLSGSGVQAGTVIIAGSGNSWTVNYSQSVSSTTITTQSGQIFAQGGTSGGDIAILGGTISDDLAGTGVPSYCANLVGSPSGGLNAWISKVHFERCGKSSSGGGAFINWNVQNGILDEHDNAFINPSGYNAYPLQFDTNTGANSAVAVGPANQYSTPSQTYRMNLVNSASAVSVTVRDFLSWPQVNNMPSSTTMNGFDFRSAGFFQCGEISSASECQLATTTGLYWQDTRAGGANFQINDYSGTLLLQDSGGNDIASFSPTTGANATLFYEPASFGSTVTVFSGTNTVYRCATAGTLPTGALTITAGNCGTTADTGLRVK